MLLLGFLIVATPSCQSCSRPGREAIARRSSTDSKVAKDNRRKKEVTPKTQPKTDNYSPPIAENLGQGASLNEMYKYLRQGVFMVSATNDGISSSNGSGFFIESSGIGITNYHVLDGYNVYFIKTSNGKVYEIDKILKSSKPENYDYIVFKVRNQGDTFTVLPIAKEESEIGEDIFAIGNPLGLEATLTRGIISGYRENGRIQIDAEIEHGSSGGPLFNMKGEVIGINTEIIEGTNLNFAVDIRKLNLATKPTSQNNQINKGNTQVSLVQRVIDGDTFVLETGEKVRLIGIDSPETVHPRKPVESFGLEASQFTKRLLEGKHVELEFDVDRYDRYNRLLAYVYVDGVFLNEELVRQGLAVIST